MARLDADRGQPFLRQGVKEPGRQRAALEDDLLGLSRVLANGLGNGLRGRRPFPRQIRRPPWRIEIVVSFRETSSPTYWSMVILHPMARPSRSSARRPQHIGGRRGATIRPPRNAARDYPMFCGTATRARFTLPGRRGPVAFSGLVGGTVARHSTRCHVPALRQIIIMQPPISSRLPRSFRRAV